MVLTQEVATLARVKVLATIMPSIPILDKQNVRFNEEIY
jgi:hypothetical protein